MTAPLRYWVRRSGAGVTVRHSDCDKIIARDKLFSIRDLVLLAEEHERGCEALA